MSWVRFDDTTSFHRKVIRAGNEAVGAWFRMTCWCAEHLTDGFLPEDVAALVAGTPEVVRRCIDAGLLDVVEGGLSVHDFLEHNPSREDVLARREAERDRKSKAGKRAGVASGKARKDSARKAHGIRPEAERNPNPRPVPSPEKTTSTPPARASQTAERLLELVGEAATGADTEAALQSCERIARAVDGMDPEIRWTDLGAEVSGWIADARLKAAAARDRGDHWSADRLVVAIEAKALQRVRYRPKDARAERDRDRATSGQPRPRERRTGEYTAADAAELVADYHRHHREAAQ